MCYLYKLRRRTKVLENFPKFITQEQLFRILISRLIVLFPSSFSNDNYNLNGSDEILRKIKKIFIYVFKQNSNDARC